MPRLHRESAIGEVVNVTFLAPELHTAGGRGGAEDEVLARGTVREYTFLGVGEGGGGEAGGPGEGRSGVLGAVLVVHG